MISKIITSFFLVFVCHLFPINIAAEQFNAPELIGIYYAGDWPIFSAIKINPEGTYSHMYKSCTYATEQSGKYDFINGTLHFTLLKFAGKKFANEKKEINLLNFKNRKKFYDNDKEDEALITESEFLPIRWGERIYLIDKDILQDFSNAVNLGFEPRTSSDIDLYYGFFFLRKGDENKTVYGKPLVPQEWQSFLLGNPVTTNIINIEEKDDVKIATIDKGSQDGLKVGMKLARKDDRPEYWSEEGVILSVENHTSKIRTYKFEIGDTLSTRFIFRNRTE